MKVKVRSIYREVLAKTGRVWDKDGKELQQFRQFAPPQIGSRDGVPLYASFGEAYMTPTEAKFLVESKENQASVSAGQEQIYHYPLGYPVPEVDNAGGHMLMAPITSATTHVSDQRQLEAAAEQMRERDAAIAKAQADAGDDEPAGDDAPQETAHQGGTREGKSRARLRSGLSGERGGGARPDLPPRLHRYVGTRYADDRRRYRPGKPPASARGRRAPYRHGPNR
jgi:hypothetical protein